MMEKTMLKIVFFLIAFLKVIWKDFGLVLGGFDGVFCRYFSQLWDTFSKLREHF